jgi:hypothetical protein
MQTRRAYADIEKQVWELRDRIRTAVTNPYQRVRRMHATYSVLAGAIDGTPSLFEEVDETVQQLAQEWLRDFANAPAAVRKEVKRILYACFVQYAVNSVGGYRKRGRKSRKTRRRRLRTRQKHRLFG